MCLKMSSFMMLSAALVLRCGIVASVQVSGVIMICFLVPDVCLLGRVQDRAPFATAQAVTCAGWYAPGVNRPAMDSRFHALIAATASVKSASSFSLKCRRASWYTASGT